MLHFKDNGTWFVYDGENGLRVRMEIEVAILDDLVRAGLGKDHPDVVSNSLKFSRLMTRYADERGNVTVLHPDEPTHTIPIHAFDVDTGAASRSLACLA